MIREKINIIRRQMNKLHSKLIVFFVLLVCIIMLIDAYRYNALNELVKESESSYTSSEKIVDVREKVDKLKVSFENYLESKDKNDKKAYLKQEKKLNKSLENIKVRNKYSDKNIRKVNLYNMTKQYIQLLSKMVSKNKNITNANVKEATKLYSYIQEYSNEIMGEQLLVDIKGYTQMKDNATNVNIWSKIISIAVLIMAVGCIITFSIFITRPIMKLAIKTKTVADGNYNLTVYDEDATGEVEELYNNFNIMTKSIKDNVDEIKRARTLEQALAKEKISLLNMSNALKEAEYNTLQSRVNPHFIFNTINIGSQLAMMNEDETTCKYLQDVADLFRYNLNGLNYNVSLEKEIQNVTSYISVMQTRYGDSISYKLSIDGTIDLNEIIVPKMTLQPLVEFLYINSVNSLEEGSSVSILINKNEKFYMIDILSTGKEIEQQAINRVMFEDLIDNKNKEKNSQTVEDKEYYMSVLGVKNSIRRLRLLYDRKDVIVLRREDNINYVTIKVPRDVQVDKE